MAKKSCLSRKLVLLPNALCCPFGENEKIFAAEKKLDVNIYVCGHTGIKKWPLE